MAAEGSGPYSLDSLLARAPIPVEIVEMPEERFSANVEAAAYYVVAEAIANVGKYANASGATVRVSRSDTRATVTVADDGSHWSYVNETRRLPADPEPAFQATTMAWTMPAASRAFAIEAFDRAGR